MSLILLPTQLKPSVYTGFREGSGSDPPCLICLDKLPKHVAEKYEVWCAIVRASGPQGLRTIKSFHDEKLSGNLAGLRSSRLNQQWRVIYRVEASIVTAFVEKISPHDYRP